MKKILLCASVAVFMVGFLALPAVSSAQTIADLQAQIQALLVQVQALQAQLKLAQGGTSNAFCYTFSVNLRFGDGGGGALDREVDVRNLQAALEREGSQVSDQEKKAGSVFEESTASAVVGFQEKYRSEILAPNGLSRGSGYVGPSTRAKLNVLYGCGSTSGGGSGSGSGGGTTIPPSVTPSITVLSPNGGETWTKGTTQNIKWQDNTPTPTQPPCPVGEICTTIPVAITLYDIALYSNPMCSGDVCIGGQFRTIAKSVYGSSYDWLIPNCTATNPCSSNFEISAGSYTIQVCQSGTSVCDSSNSYFKITSAISTNNPPKIGSGSGPGGSIQPGQTVNFSWNATDADNDDLSWSVDWGETNSGGGSGGGGSTGPACSIFGTKQNGANQNYSTSHSWVNIGTYKVTATVSDCRGGSDSNSFTVVVGSLTQPSITYFKADSISSSYPNAYRVSWLVANAASGVKFSIDCKAGLTMTVITGSSLQCGSNLEWPVESQGSWDLSFINSTQNIITISTRLWVSGINGASAVKSISIPPSVTPSITVLSPNGGETWTQGNTQTIRWSASASVSNISITLNYTRPVCTTSPCPLYPTIDVQPYTLARSVSNTGSFSWTINSSLDNRVIPTGTYTITIADVTPHITGVYSSVFSDTSDAPFTIVAGTTSTGALTVSADSSQPVSGQIVMGATQVPLAAYRFGETTNNESIKITSATILDSVSPAGAKSSFSSLKLYNGSNLVGVAGAPNVSGGAGSSGGVSASYYQYTFTFASPVIVSQANSITLVLKGDVSSYISSGATDNSVHTFKLSGGWSSGQSSGVSTQISISQISPPNGNSQTVLRTKLTVGATPLGMTTSRMVSTIDDLANINFTADPAGAVQINSVKLTFGGTAPSNSFYTSSAGTTCSTCAVQLYDPATGTSYYPTVSDASNKALIFDLGNYIIAGGSSKSFILRINSIGSGFNLPSNGVFLTLSAAINAASDVAWKDGLDSAAIGGLGLQASSVPIQMNAVSYAAGTGGTSQAESNSRISQQLANIEAAFQKILEEMHALGL